MTGRFASRMSPPSSAKMQVSRWCGTRWDIHGQQFQLKFVKFPTRVMVWSVMCFKGTGRLHVVEGTMNSKKYVDVLKDCLLPQLQEWFRNENFIFMQDGAPCHTQEQHEIPTRQRYTSPQVARQ